MSSVGEHYEKGYLLVGAKMYNEAVIELTRAVEIDPTFTTAWCELGIAYARLGKFHDAIKAYDRALELEPNDAEYLSCKGTAYLQLNDFEAAYNAYNLAVKGSYCTTAMREVRDSLAKKLGK